jgi:hypothetical protein
MKLYGRLNLLASLLTIIIFILLHRSYLVVISSIQKKYIITKIESHRICVKIESHRICLSRLLYIDFEVNTIVVFIYHHKQSMYMEQMIPFAL